MIYLPEAKIWLNLDRVQYVFEHEDHNGLRQLYACFSGGNEFSGPEQIVTRFGDVPILEAALNARCADEAGEAFLP